MDEQLIEAARQRLQDARRILVVSHVRPDGDAVGSVLAFGLALESVGKDAQMVLSDGVPSGFKHLEGSEKIHTKPEGEFDMRITVDCSDLKRTGDALSAPGNGTERHIPDLNVDHHITNLNFGKLNLVEGEAAATAEILAKFLPAVGLPLTRAVANALLTGIVTDTLGFRTSNTTPQVLRTSADLMEAGGDLQTVYWHGLIKRSYASARYWGQGLSKLERDDRMVWATLTLEDREVAGYPGRDDADLINIITSIDEADVGLIFVEQHDGVKISWRAQNDFDVSKIASQFGGGGHQAAAGADIKGSLGEIQPRVLEVTRAAYEQYLLSQRDNTPQPANAK